MIAIGLRFPAGRFHATPWGRHVNEGVPEWPPSPWRLLRSLIAVWKVKAPQVSEADVRAVLDQLIAPASFHLPPATTGHSRHYMRWYKKGPEDQTLVFDAFVCLDRRSEVKVVWPEAQLDSNDRSTLATLLDLLGYLGRAESWCEARLLGDDETKEQLAKVDCQPLNGQSPSGNQELVRVLCADPAEAFGSKHVTPTTQVGKGKKKQEGRESLYDPNWHLCIETAQLHAERWSDPPGSSWVTYARRTDCFSRRARPLARRPSRLHIEVARYALDAPVLPLVSETLRLAERARIALMGRYKLVKLSQLLGQLIRSNADIPPDAPTVRSQVFSGKDEQGRKLEGHQHAFYLPTDEDEDGRIDHLTVVAASGFDSLEIKTLDRLRHLHYGDGDSLNLLLVGLGKRDDFRALLFGESRQWISVTPFIATRYPKRNGRKRDAPELLGLANEKAFAAHVLGEELERLRQRYHTAGIDFPENWQIEPLPEHRMGAHRLRPIQFKRFRQKRSDDGGRRHAGAFRITFPVAVRGPICLGIHSHFGMGLFVPDARTA